jgi:hypothetical protein
MAMGSMSARRRAGACLLTVMLVNSGCIGGEATPAPVDATPIAADGFTGSPEGGGGLAPAAGQLTTGMAGDGSLGPPGWVQPGMRLTWYGAAASVAQSSYTYVEDENGTWEDPTTGKRYRRTDESGEGMPTAAGEAYTETDVIAVEGGDVVLVNTMYSIDLLARQLVLNPLGGGRSPGVLVDGAWVNPDVLASVAATGYEGYQILRGDYTLDGNTYAAVSFVSSGPGAYQASTFDTASGVLLRTNTSTEGAASPVRGPLDDPQGNVQLSNTRLVGARQRSLPGMTAPVPWWVAPGGQLVYSGSYTATNPLDPSSGPWVFPMESTVTFQDVGTTWATIASRTVTDLGGSPQASEGTSATGPTGLYWYDPASLAAMSPGDLLDEDPVTGARTSVEAVGPGASGTVATILTELNGLTIRTGYDVGTGVLVSLELIQAVTGGTVSLQLASGLPG